MKNYAYSPKSMIFFFCFVLVLSFACEAMALLGYSVGGLLIYLFPSLGCLLAVAIDYNSKVRGFSWKEYFHRAGLKKCKLRFLLMAFLIPIMYHFVSYGIFWLIFPESLQINELSPSLILPYFIIVFLCAFGEELGWRGYMVPALFERLGLKKTLIVSGLIWAAWHLPMIFFGSYNEGTSLLYKFVAFMLDIMPAAMIMAIFTLKSGSIWPATVFHASHNYFDQIILRPMTVADNKMYFISETGIISIICIWAFAIGIYIHEKKSNTLETHTLD